jgi:5,10-methylenetetrahydromethanopterin reductase
VDISCAFATSSDTPEHVQLAESLGYRRAWLYDSPALYPHAALKPKVGYFESISS